VTILDSVKNIEVVVQHDLILGNETAPKVRRTELAPVFAQRPEAASEKVLDPVKNSGIIPGEDLRQAGSVDAVLRCTRPKDRHTVGDRGVSG